MTAIDPTRSIQAPPSTPGADPRNLHRNPARSTGRLLLAAAVGLVIGLVAGGLGRGGFQKPRQMDQIVKTPTPEPRGLSGETLAVLQSLDNPVQIEFYAMLDTATVPEDVAQFAIRAGNLLAAYASASGGKIKVTELHSRSDVPAAGAAGMKPFNLNKGQVSYLGLKVVQGGRSESLPRLFPAWEPALEADISRAISRVLAAPAELVSTAAVASPALPADPALVAEVKRQIPNFDSISMEEGIQILRDSALKDMQVALGENGAQIKEVAQKVAQKQRTKSGAELQVALKELQRLQAEQAAKLGEYATKSSAQVEALRQIKETAR